MDLMDATSALSALRREEQVALVVIEEMEGLLSVWAFDVAAYTGDNEELMSIRQEKWLDNRNKRGCGGGGGGDVIVWRMNVRTL